jgi:hypothetical protein
MHGNKLEKNRGLLVSLLQAIVRDVKERDGRSKGGKWARHSRAMKTNGTHENAHDLARQQA